MPSRYSVQLVDGAVVIKRASKSFEMTEEEVLWIRELIRDTKRQAGARLEGLTVSRIRPDGYVVKQGKHHEIPEVVDQMTILQRQKGIQNASITEFMGVDPSMICSYKSGRARIRLEHALVWAWMLGRDLMLVPIPLRERVKEMIADWRRDKELDS